MTNPFHPADEAVEKARDLDAISETVGMGKCTKRPPQPPPQGSESSPARKDSEEPVMKKKKRGFFGRMFGAKEPDSEVADEKTKAEVPPEKSEAVMRHEELIESVGQICRTLESTKSQKMEVKLADILPPIPAENFEILSNTQVKVADTMAHMVGRMDEAEKRDVRVVESLTRVDQALSELSRVGEKSATTMDGMKGVFVEVSGTLKAMQIELKKSASRYEELCENVRETEQKNVESIVKLQRQTLIVTSLIGIAVVVGLIVFAMAR